MIQVETGDDVYGVHSTFVKTGDIMKLICLSINYIRDNIIIQLNNL